jgi:hypothetical protein
MTVVFMRCANEGGCTSADDDRLFRNLMRGVSGVSGQTRSTSFFGVDAQAVIRSSKRVRTAGTEPLAAKNEADAPFGDFRQRCS